MPKYKYSGHTLKLLFSYWGCVKKQPHGGFKVLIHNSETGIHFD